MIPMYWMLCLAVLWTSEVIATQINLEVPYHELSKQTYTIPKNNALFGYSIAYQKTINSLIVGSPLENNMGQVYLCPIKENDENCTKARIPSADFSSEKINHTWWLGARVDAGDSFYIACAPRFINDLQTNGRCYYKDTRTSDPRNLLQMVPMPKLTTKQKTDYHVAAFQESPSTSKQELWADTFGLSSYVHNSRVFIGGPVMSIGRTQVYTEVKGLPLPTPTLISVNNAYLKKNNDNRNVAFNFGYSITSGNFINSDDDVAISTTYGTIGYGRIYFYTYNGIHYEANDVWADGKEVANVGSLFGASLATLNVIGNRSVLLVGAPAYATSGYDVGAVFIYKFDSEILDVKINLLKKLLGGNVEKSGSRFGASIVTVGDFDGDEIDEVAIAAPFENDGSGAVYLYSGKELVDNTNLRVPFMQRLLPEENPNKAQFFGLSLTALKDAYENGCNELAIGAPGVSSVLLLHCIASVNVSFNASFPDLTEQAKTLNLTDAKFTYRPCLVVQPYKKPHPKTIETEISFSIQVIHPDVKILDSKNYTKTYIKNYTLHDVISTACEELTILLPQKADYDRDILFNISVNLFRNPLVERKFNPRLVLLNKGTVYSELFKVPALPGSNLTFQIHTTFNESHEYMIGSSESENLTISMWNAGNTAHGACVRTRLNGVTITHLPDHRICNFSNGELVCGKETLTRGDHLGVQVALSTKTLTSSHDRINITSTLFTSHCEKSTGQTKNITVKLTRDSKFSIKKFSIPRLVNFTEQDFVKGKNIDHNYEITNKGITVWTNVLCQVALPPQVTVKKVTVQTTPPVNCKVQKHVAHCNITELNKNIPINIRIQMNIEPNSPFVDLIKKGKATVDTELSLMLKDTKPENITTILTLWEAPKVPLWMIVVASLFALLIVVIFIWVLHECGCLKRAKKQKLQELKRDVQRQSMRKSMMLRQSTIEVIPNKGDRERLLNVPEEDIGSQDGELHDHDHRNEKPVKEIHIDDNDPARVAFNAELAKALAKGGQKVVTEAEIH